VSTSPIKRFLTLTEISNEYGSSSWTWRKRATDGLVASYKPAGIKSRILIERSEVERFLNAGMRPRVSQEQEQPA
jgi:hypothetical protein